MDPSTWNMLQPPIPEPSAMDFNRSMSMPQPGTYGGQSQYSPNPPRYNGFYDPPTVPNSYQQNPAPKSAPPSYQNPANNTNMSYPSNSFFGGPNSNSSNSYQGPNGVSYPNYPGPTGPTSTAQPNPQMNYMNRGPSAPSAPNNDVNSQSRYYSNNSSQSQYTPPVADFKIGTFTLNSSGIPSEGNSSHDNTGNSYNSNSAPHSNGSYHNTNGVSTSSAAAAAAAALAANNARETGIIEKLLQTYGFIQCCERQARLFFHFSQFDGNTEHLRIGDPVEFEVTFDRRTGKPIASTVTKIAPEVVLSEERVTGCVTTEPRTEGTREYSGRITYENRGECFFLPFGKDDVEGYVTLKPSNKVSFQIATNQRTGNLTASHIRLENPSEPVKYQGVVSAIKDSFGFIERADVVDEIFFHFSESKNVPGGLKLGDDVEFLIVSRSDTESFQTKEVATNLVKLPQGTVVFEDINQEEMRGQVLKSVEKSMKQNQKDPLTGRIRYRGKDRSEVEVKFGERDQKGDFTLRHGDWVKFNIATDRRDHLQKATHISLLDDSFNVSGEKREHGVVSCLKDGFGYIRCCERESKMYFQYSEILDTQREISLSEEVEFTVVMDQNQVSQPSQVTRQSAIRIRRIPKGTVKFEVIVQCSVQGEVILEPVRLDGNSSDTNPDMNYQPGMIQYERSDAPCKFNINFYPVDAEETPKLQNKVEFDIYLIKSTKEHVARNIKVVGPIITSVNPNAMSSRHSMVGSGRTFDHRGNTATSTISSGAPPVNRDRGITYADPGAQQKPFTPSPISSSSSAPPLNPFVNALQVNQGYSDNPSKGYPDHANLNGLLSQASSINNQNSTSVVTSNSTNQQNSLYTQLIGSSTTKEEQPLGLSNNFMDNEMNWHIYEFLQNKNKSQNIDSFPTPVKSTLNPSQADNIYPNVSPEQKISQQMPNFNKYGLDPGSINMTPLSVQLANVNSNQENGSNQNGRLENSKLNNIKSQNSVLARLESSFNQAISNSSSSTLMNGLDNNLSPYEKNETDYVNVEDLIEKKESKDKSSSPEQAKQNGPIKIVGSKIIGNTRNLPSGDVVVEKEVEDVKKEAPITRSSGQSDIGRKSSRQSVPVHKGYIAALKENFGFIETINHDKEIFFHFSNIDTNASEFELGMEVEYTISPRTGPGGKLSAENVKILPVGSLPRAKVLGEVFEGSILRSMRSVNPEQPEYCGLLCRGEKEEKLGRHQFGIVGLVNKKELLQPLDQVTFQLDENGWAVNIRAVRKKLLAVVEAVKGQYGFLTYDIDEGKKLFFHQSEVKDGVTLSPGDEVQFVIITNNKTGKSAACNITRLTTANGPSQRPSRLVSKLKTMSLDTSIKRMSVVRQPRGPDGTKGFKFAK